MSRAQRAAAKRYKKAQAAKERAAKKALREASSPPRNTDESQFRIVRPEVEAFLRTKPEARVVRGPQLAIAGELAPSSRPPWDSADHRRQRTIDQRLALGLGSDNAKDRQRGVMSVVTVRLRSKILDKLDAIVEDAIGHNPPITRSWLIQEAVLSYIAEIERERELETRRSA